MIKKSTLKLFLTSGVTLTVGEDEVVTDVFGQQMDLFTLCDFIDNTIKDKVNLKFMAEIDHNYKDDDGEIKSQKIKHYYNIPFEKVSWFMIEEV